MSDLDFQNGFIAGAVSGGVFEESTEQIELVKTLVGDVTPIQEELQVASDMLGGQDV